MSHCKESVVTNTEQVIRLPSKDAAGWFEADGRAGVVFVETNVQTIVRGRKITTKSAIGNLKQALRHPPYEQANRGGGTER